MTEQEIEEGNQKIELHNKFCFMKKKLPMYKKSVSLMVPVTYMLISATLLALPTLLCTSYDCVMFSNNNKITQIE